MAQQLWLRNKFHTLETAAQSEDNLVLFHKSQNASEKFKLELWQQRDSIAALIRHHLRMRQNDKCTVLPQDYWIEGGFNLCIMVQVKTGDCTKYLVFRVPMPHKLAERHYPGSIDEKVTCKAATYIWMQEYCPDIRIPDLLAFGLTDGSHFVQVQQAPIHTRICHRIWQWVYRCLRYQILSDYVRDSAAPAIHNSYMLLEHIGSETGEMLSTTWSKHFADEKRRGNLYKRMAHIMLSLARLPQTHIGSFKFNAQDGTTALSNRPLICSMAIFEHSGTQRNIQPHQLYQNTDSFASDMLTLHDNQLLHDPHAVRDEGDAQERMALRTLLRAVSHFYISPDRRNGPFLMQLTDFHRSNMFVDKDWNITCLIDLEWICALPVEMLSAPYWLTGCSIDGICDEQYEQFDEARKAFLASMDAELQNIKMEHNIQITKVMRELWESKGVWFWECLISVNGWLFIIEDHIIPRFSAAKKLVESLEQLSFFWKEDAGRHIKTKVADEEKYLAELRSLFENSKS